jgi:predicted SnoaL-like aldol condensation-catalyzing enzyme
MATLHKTSVLVEEYKKHMLLCYDGYDAIMLCKAASIIKKEPKKSWKLLEVMAEKPF